MRRGGRGGGGVKGCLERGVAGANVSAQCAECSVHSVVCRQRGRQHPADVRATVRWRPLGASVSVARGCQMRLFLFMCLLIECMALSQAFG